MSDQAECNLQQIALYFLFYGYSPTIRQYKVPVSIIHQGLNQLAVQGHSLIEWFKQLLRIEIAQFGYRHIHDKYSIPYRLVERISLEPINIELLEVLGGQPPTNQLPPPQSFTKVLPDNNYTRFRAGRLYRQGVQIAIIARLFRINVPEVIESWCEWDRATEEQREKCTNLKNKLTESMEKGHDYLQAAKNFNLSLSTIYTILGKDHVLACHQREEKKQILEYFFKFSSSVNDLEALSGLPIDIFRRITDEYEANGDVYDEEPDNWLKGDESGYPYEFKRDALEQYFLSGDIAGACEQFDVQEDKMLEWLREVGGIEL